MKRKNKLKDPSLKFRYSRGLGDAIASILHGKIFGWFTHFVTGRNFPCQRCTMRADVLNILFPIPFWRLFFKTIEELTSSLGKELEENGYAVNFTNDKKGISASRNIKDVNPPEDTKPKKDRTDINNYTFVSNTKSIVGDLLLEIKVYKYK